jgi:hypothetical protein
VRRVTNSRPVVRDFSQVHKPISGRSGVIPEPTVQSGCEKEIDVTTDALILDQGFYIFIFFLERPSKGFRVINNATSHY